MPQKSDKILLLIRTRLIHGVSGARAIGPMASVSVSATGDLAAGSRCTSTDLLYGLPGNNGAMTRCSFIGTQIVWPSDRFRSEEHTSELQSLMRISYAVFCLKKKTNMNNTCKQHHPFDTKQATIYS